MANHKSAIKRTRSDYTKNQHNKYIHKTTRNAIKKLETGQVPINTAELSKVFSLIDKLVKSNVIHKNKAANLKSKLSRLSTDSSPEKKAKKRQVKKKEDKTNVKTMEAPVDESPVDESPVDESPVDESPVDDEGSTEKE